MFFVYAGRRMTALFAATLFLSAWLLFCVEPMVAKMLLPLLGGVPSVWNACLVFFQGALLGGYLFALVSLKALGPRRQAVVQTVLVALPLLVLPIFIDENLAARFAKFGPVGQVLAILTVGVGLPFFALSTIGPTLQRWFSTTKTLGAHDPYFLYAASNLGSLGALLAYPVIFEPRMGLHAQASAMRWGYWGLAVLVGACAVATWRAEKREEHEAKTSAPIDAKRRLRWVFLAAVPSAYLVAVTAHITTDVAPTPLLWTLPLAAYLLTFVLVFAQKIKIPHAKVVRFFPLAATAVAYLLSNSASDPVYIVVPLHLIGFFGAAMLCHGEMARDRPEPAKLPEFYVWMSFGGFLGGIAVALITPVIFTRAVEYPACLVLALLARPRLEGDAKADSLRQRQMDYGVPLLALAGTMTLAFAARAMPLSMRQILTMAPIIPLLLVYHMLTRPTRFGLAIGAILIAASFFPSPLGNVILRDRNFFGSLTVSHDRRERWIEITHGTTIHGLQTLDPAGKKDPRSYYTRSGPIGQVFDLYGHQNPSPRVAIIGLGAGTLATYAKEGQDWTFFEINPAVIRVAQDPAYFTYLHDAFPDPSKYRIIEGDARLELGTTDGNFGLLVIDAFSSDAIPVHLITKEAAKLYVSKMAPGGLIAWHISNRSLDLRPVLAELAESVGWKGYVKQDTVLSDADAEFGKAASIWAVMAADEFTLVDLKMGPGSTWESLMRRKGFDGWTDEKSSIFSVLTL